MLSDINRHAATAVRLAIKNIMNDSTENYKILTSCKVGRFSFQFLSHFPNKKYERVQIVGLVINCILLFSTISLNGISVITIRKSSQLRSKVCYFVILLQSVVDLGVGVLSTPLLIHYLVLPLVNSANCNLTILTMRASYLPPGFSIVTLSAMAMERYMGVLQPFRYKLKVTKKRILMFVCAGGAIHLSLVAYSFCERSVIRIWVGGLIFAFLVLTGFVYTRIYLVIRKLIRSERRPACKRQIIRETRRARSCFLVIICSVLSLLPATLSPVLFSYGSVDFIVYFSWSFTLVILNSSINSVIFFWTKTQLRREALKILKSLCL